MELSLQSKYIKDLYFSFPPDICHKSVFPKVIKAVQSNFVGKK